MADPLERELPDSCRVSRVTWLCDSGIRREYRILLVPDGPGPRLHTLRRLRPRSPARPFLADGFARRACLGWGFHPGPVAEGPPHPGGTVARPAPIRPH